MYCEEKIIFSLNLFTLENIPMSGNCLCWKSEELNWHKGEHALATNNFDLKKKETTRNFCSLFIFLFVLDYFWVFYLCGDF